MQKLVHLIFSHDREMEKLVHCNREKLVHLQYPLFLYN